MGFFSKNADPITERARTLNNEIATLEAQIKRLTAQQEKTARKQTQTAPAAKASNVRRAKGSLGSPQTNTTEPVFEDIQRNNLNTPPAPGNAEESGELMARTSDLPGTVRKLVKQLKGPPGSNPRLVNYLAAGSIQGLRPLRYEKRVARNRFLFLVVFLVLLLLGILTSFIRH